MSLERLPNLLDKVSPTRAIYGNVRGIRLRELPIRAFMKIIHSTEARVHSVPRPTATEVFARSIQT